MTTTEPTVSLDGLRRTLESIASGAQDSADSGIPLDPAWVSKRALSALGWAQIPEPDEAAYAAHARATGASGISVPADEVTTIHLPGSTAIQVDPDHRVITVDCTSMTRFPGVSLCPEWLVEDLRTDQYGDFHSLRPAAECFDAEHARSGEHATAEERATVRDTFGAEQVTPVTEEG